jgi:hypothetical protein
MGENMVMHLLRESVAGMNANRILAALVLLTVAAAAADLQDRVLLVSGGKIIGQVISEDDDALRVKVGPGIMVIQRAKVASIERAAEVAPVYAASATASRPAASAKPAAEKAPKKSPLPPGVVVTREMFDQLKSGMTPDEVFSILGKNYTLERRRYNWRNKDGGHVYVEFGDTGLLTSSGIAIGPQGEIPLPSIPETAAAPAAAPR